MNKRDFIVHGGALVGSAALPLSMAHASVDTPVAVPAAQPAPTQIPQCLREWQALQGASFDARTPLGRPVQLVLSGITSVSPTMRNAALEQFTLTLEGPRGSPLQPGLHALTHPELGRVQLYLEPVARAEQISYNAHFSLLA